MKNLKNISLALVSTLALATTSLSAEVVKDFHIGVSQIEVLEESAIAYTLGYGYGSYKDSGFYWGGSFDFDMMELEDEAAYSYRVDMKVGYTPDKKLAIYVLGGVAMQTINDVNGQGLGYGLGVDYRVFEQVAVSAEYRTYDMTLNGLMDYKYSLAGVNLKYTF